MDNKQKANEITQLADYTHNINDVDVVSSAMDLYKVWKEDHIGELKQALIDKACKWLKEQESWDYYNDAPCKLMSKDKIAEFRRIMEDENIKA